MLIYHGSDICVTQPKILPANRLLDFGEGFYTTSSREQAQRWTRRIKERKNSNDQIISVYEFDATVQLFETGLLSETETIVRLKVEKIYDQILFHNEKSLRYCTFLRSETVTEQKHG